MESKKIIEVLNQARRALDSLPQIEIIEEWKFDKDLKVWYLHVCIQIEYVTTHFPLKSQWYFIVDSEYPKGKIKVYPDIKNSIVVTLYHQANNSKVESNGLWRNGALCLDVNTISEYEIEPKSIDERLLYHAKRAINWIESAAKDELVTESEPFELPEFTINKQFEMKFAFSEDEISFMQWESTGCKYGIAELDVYKSKPFVYYVKKYKSLDGKVEQYTEWGTHLSKAIISPPIKALWLLLDDVPVINEWQAPENFGDLVSECKKQNVDLMNILKDVLSEIRDGKQHLFLLGFPIPKTFGGEKEIIYWQAWYMPTVSYGKKTAKGFRANQQGWWLRDKSEVLKTKIKLDWIDSENWNQHEISQRGRINNLMLRKRILIIGTGCIGASIAEIMVRSGIYNLTVADFDIFEVGNLSRHVLDMKNIGQLKENSLCNYLNLLNPHAIVKKIDNTLTIDENNKTNIDLDKYDIILDCTGENSVLDILNKAYFNKNHIVASVSVGLGAKRLYLTLMNGNKFDFNSFYEFIAPYLDKERSLYDIYGLPRNGIGCWHPTFPGRSDDIWLAAATSVKAIENYFISENKNTLSLIYQQRERNGVFESYEVVSRQEYE